MQSQEAYFASAEICYWVAFTLWKKDKLNKAQLNKALELCGTPLTLCAANDNLGAFIAIAEKGADIGKKCCGDSPLKKALNHSYF